MSATLAEMHEMHISATQVDKRHFDGISTVSNNPSQEVTMLSSSPLVLLLIALGCISLTYAIEDFCAKSYFQYVIIVMHLCSALSSSEQSNTCAPSVGRIAW